MQICKSSGEREHQISTKGLCLADLPSPISVATGVVIEMDSPEPPFMLAGSSWPCLRITGDVMLTDSLWPDPGAALLPKMKLAICTSPLGHFVTWNHVMWIAKEINM